MQAIPGITIKQTKPALDSIKRAEDLKELEERPMWIKAFLGGPSGAGKTHSSITLPRDDGKPLLLIDLDNRWETVREEMRAGLVEVKTIFDPEPTSPKAWDELEKLRKELWALARKNEFPYSGIIEDGLSQLSSYAKNSAVTLRGKDGKDNTGLGGTPSQGHWGAQISYVEKHVNSIRNLPCHYVLNGHFDIEKNEDDGKLRVMPKITKSLRSVIPSWFNEVYLCWRKADGSKMRYFWTTAGTEMYEFFKSTLNTRQMLWEDPIEIDFGTKLDWWNGPLVGFAKLVELRKNKLGV